VYRQQQHLSEENKLTLEKNAAILKEIAQKSEAASVLGKLPEAHWEVFELCDHYLNRSEKELETVRVGSPRLATLNRSREKVRNLHKFHLLAWSSAESRSLIQEAQTSVTISKKLEIATRALNILDSALQFYPNEQTLLESATAVNEFIASAKISHWIEQAERAAFKGNYKRAINHYRDALFYLARQNVRSSERDLIADKINLEIGKLKEISTELHKTKPFHE
jgi:tetratricopeptide (TPR) repeat protein